MSISSGSKEFIAGEPYRAKGFSKLSSADLSLKMHVSPSQIDYMIAEKKNNRVLCLQPYQNTISKGDQSITRFLAAVLSGDELLKKSFGEVSFEILTTDFTLSPVDFTNARLAEAWKKRFTHENESSTLRRDQISDMNVEVDYAVQNEVMNLLGGIFKEFKLHHSITNQIKSLQLRNHGRTVYCNVQSGFVQVMYLNSTQLMFANIFSYQSAEDFIYFLLATYKQYHLDPENVKVVLLGEIMKDSALFHLVYKYIRNIEFGKPSHQWKFDDDYPFPPHFYFSLFCS